MRLPHITLLLCIFALTTAAWGETRMVNAFASPAELAQVKASKAKVTPVSARAGDEKPWLRVEFEPAPWPHVSITPEQPWDWRGYDGLALEVSNPGAEEVRFGVRIDDNAEADGHQHCRTGGCRIAPGKTLSVVIPFGQQPMDLGMRGLPKPPGFVEMGADGEGTFDSGHIVTFQIFLHNPAKPKTLLFSNVRLLHLPGVKKIVDAFGQYTGAEWPGKVQHAEELAARGNVERETLAAQPTLAERDRYGGWAKGPQLAATGFFRTEKVKDKWWLVTPDGHLFFSVGIDSIRIQNPTLLTGRESMFNWLPGKDEPAGKFYGYTKRILYGPLKEGEDYDFYQANLLRKYGEGYRPAWTANTLARLPAWGFNTIGNWSDNELFYRNGRIPYVATVGIGGGHAHVASGADYWGLMHDPYDPRFAEDVADAISATAAKVRDDPYCVGYFVDNELSWGGWGDDKDRYGLALGALHGNAVDSPAKRALLTQLRAKYGTVVKLNAAWGTVFPDWATLAAPFQPGGEMSAAMRVDFAAFVTDFARGYFTVIHNAIKQADPQHLYLGCRFAWRTPEAVQAAAQICDVVSFNIYAVKIETAEWQFLNDLQKPCLIGEFHFGALDRGMFHTGLVAAPDQHGRGAMYRDYLRSVLDHPALVGCHWFQYLDEPLTGRDLDGENYNIGFVSITDTPYPELVTAARAANAEIYSRRYGE